MEIRYEMDGATWREARKAFMLRRLIAVVAVVSGGALAAFGTGGAEVRFGVAILWPLLIGTALFVWYKPRIHPEYYPVGTYIIRASPEVLELEYSVGHAWFSWEYVQWTRRSGFLVAWIRGSGVVCLPPGTFTEAQEAELLAFKANASGHHPSPPVRPGYDDVAVTVTNSRGLRVRGTQVFFDDHRQRNRRGQRIMWALSALLAVVAVVVLCTGDPWIIGLAIFDAAAFGALASLSFWGPYVGWLRKPVGERFSFSAGPKGIWVHSVRGTTAIQWVRITQILRGRATTAICVGSQVTPIPDLAFERTLDGEAFAERARAWRERAIQRTEIPRPEGVLSVDTANPFAPPACS